MNEHLLSRAIARQVYRERLRRVRPYTEIESSLHTDTDFRKCGHRDKNEVLGATTPLALLGGVRVQWSLDAASFGCLARTRLGVSVLLVAINDYS